VEAGEAAKSISVEQTYEHDLVGPADLERELLRMSDRLAVRLRRAGMVARTLQVKVRFGDFTTLTRSRTFAAPLDTAHEIYEIGRSLLDRAGIGDRPVRLLGVGGDSLVPAAAPRQLDLEPAAWGDLEDAVERVRARFGDAAIGPARLAGGGEGAPPHPGDEGADGAD
jgi:DNA polymerase-4